MRPLPTSASPFLWEPQCSGRKTNNKQQAKKKKKMGWGRDAASTRYHDLCDLHANALMQKLTNGMKPGSSETEPHLHEAVLCDYCHVRAERTDRSKAGPGEVAILHVEGSG